MNNLIKFLGITQVAPFQKSPEFDEILAEHLRQLEAAQQLPANWMTQLLPYIGDRTLDNICLPRSHDAGMYTITKLIRLASESTTRTQTKDILSQLRCGVRMFDIRPCIRGNEFYCGHYQYIKDDQIPGSLRPLVDTLKLEIPNRYHGADGATISSVIHQVNEFTKDHNEIIILEMTHSFNFDRERVGEEWSLESNQEDWNRLLERLSQLNHLYISNSNTPLTQTRIQELIGGGKAAVIVTASFPGHVSLGKFAGKGFYEQKQIEHLRQEHLTHVQTTTEAICAFLYDKGFGGYLNVVVACTPSSAFDSPFIKSRCYSITDGARKIKNEKLDKVASSVSPYPNFISMDDITDGMLANEAIKVIGKAITGRDISLRFEGGRWNFV